MKFPYKYIAVLVVTALCATFAYQAYWLVSLYGSQKREMRRRVAEALRMSDYNEMVMRIGRLQCDTAGPHGEISVSAGRSGEGHDMLTSTTTTTVAGRGGQVRSETRMVCRPDSLQAAGAAQAADDDLPLLQEAGELVQFFQRAIHSGVDGVARPDYRVCDSLLRVELRAIGLDVPYRLEVVRRGQPDSLAAYFGTAGYVPSAEAETYTYAFDMEGREVYRLRMEPVAAWVVRQMAGILLTSLLILCILAFAFFYLIRTMLRQKSLEEMTSDFTHNMTHELKTPVAVAYAANDALLHFGGMEDEERRTRYLEITREQLAKLGGLVERILSMSMGVRQEKPLRCEDVELAPMVAALAEQHRLKAGRPVDVQADIWPEGLCVRADRDGLYHMLDNLMDNAVKYSLGEVRIRIAARELPDEAGKRRVAVSVADEGIGIPRRAQRHVFRKFYRAPQGDRHDVKGYGLGLYYVKHLVERHGGRISLRSEPGRGTTFTLEL